LAANHITRDARGKGFPSRAATKDGCDKYLGQQNLASSAMNRWPQTVQIRSVVRFFACKRAAPRWEERRFFSWA
jgi:hypothetical protein